MTQKTCPLCKFPIDAGEAVCPHCGEKQAFVSPPTPIPWNAIGAVVMVVAAAAIGSSGWASVGRTKAANAKAEAAPEEPTAVVMTDEEAKVTTKKIRRRLVDDLSQWDRMADFGSARLKPNGVLELTARVQENDPGRRVAKFVSSHVASSVGGRFKVRGLAVNASNGNRLLYRPLNDPIPSKTRP